MILVRKKKKPNEVNKAIKYRLYPTEEQIIMFHKTFGCCRKVWNLMLADKKQGYDSTGLFPDVSPAQYKDEYPYLKEVDSLALANTQQHLNTAFQARFSKKRKKKNRFPKFKSRKKAKKSYTTNNQNGTIAIIGNGIKLPKVGIVKAVVHRQPESNWILKSATITQDSAGNYYASVLFAYEKVASAVSTNTTNAIGLDYASDGFYVDSNGHKGTNHKYFRESQKKLAKEQKRLSRKKGSKKSEPKSNNYLKQQKKVNKIHRRVANQRKDNLHKISTAIAKQYDVVCVETLNMKSMSNKGFHNGKATMDNGYGMFLSMLDYKLAERGKYLIKVSKWFPSSQICNNCGELHPEMKDLTNRTMRCECGHVMSRDQNAALNILQEGLRLLHTA